MKTDKTNEKVYDLTQAETPLEDDVMASVSGGTDLGTGSLEESISKGELMNNLWSKLESHKENDYGKAVKKAAYGYITNHKLQSIGKGLRFYATAQITVTAKDNTVKVNGVSVN